LLISDVYSLRLPTLDPFIVLT